MKRGAHTHLKQVIPVRQCSLEKLGSGLVLVWKISFRTIGSFPGCPDRWENIKLPPEKLSGLVPDYSIPSFLDWFRTLRTGRGPFRTGVGLVPSTKTSLQQNITQSSFRRPGPWAHWPIGPGPIWAHGPIWGIGGVGISYIFGIFGVSGWL